MFQSRFFSTNNNNTSHITRAVCTLFETKNQNKQSISNRLIFKCLHFLNNERHAKLIRKCLHFLTMNGACEIDSKCSFLFPCCIS